VYAGRCLEVRIDFLPARLPACLGILLSPTTNPSSCLIITLCLPTSLCLCLSLSVCLSVCAGTVVVTLFVPYCLTYIECRDALNGTHTQLRGRAKPGRRLWHVISHTHTHTHGGRRTHGGNRRRVAGRITARQPQRLSERRLDMASPILTHSSLLPPTPSFVPRLHNVHVVFDTTLRPRTYWSHTHARQFLAIYTYQLPIKRV